MNHRISDSFPIRSYPYRVFYADTDAGGVVYYAQYLRMFEQTRTLYMEDCGLSLVRLAEENCLFVCRRAETDYLISARLGDSLEIETWIGELGRTFITFSYKILCSNRRDEEDRPLHIADGVTKIVAVAEKNGKTAPIRIPASVLDALKQGRVDE